MAKKVTDPTLISKIEGARKVTDPALKERLTQASSETGAKKKSGWFNRLIRSIRAAYTAFKTEWRKV